MAKQTTKSGTCIQLTSSEPDLGVAGGEPWWREPMFLSAGWMIWVRWSGTMVVPSWRLGSEIVITRQELVICVRLFGSRWRTPPIGFVLLQWKIITTSPTTSRFGFMTRCVHSFIKMGAFPFACFTGIMRSWSSTGVLFPFFLPLTVWWWLAFRPIRLQKGKKKQKLKYR